MANNQLVLITIVVCSTLVQSKPSEPTTASPNGTSISMTTPVSSSRYYSSSDDERSTNRNSTRKSIYKHNVNSLHSHTNNHLQFLDRNNSTTLHNAVLLRSIGKSAIFSKKGGLELVFRNAPKNRTVDKQVVTKHANSSTTYLTPIFTLILNDTTSTMRPLRIHLTRKPITNKIKLKPTAGKLKVKKKPPLVSPSTGGTAGVELKQHWYENGVPYNPMPMPEISTSSPLPTRLQSSSSSNAVSDSLIVNQDEVLNVIPSDGSNQLSNAITTFNLDMLPASQLANSNPLCPTVHISSAVLTPQQRQECSDLNLVINSHFHQNQNAPLSTPRAPAQLEDLAIVEDEPPIEENLDSVPLASVSEDVGPLADATAPASSPASGVGGGSGGPGSWGGLPQFDLPGLPSTNGLQLPDLSIIGDALRWAVQGIWNFITNPYLYLVPMGFFFVIGFIAVFVFFPWWLPLLIFYLATYSSRTPPPRQVAVYTHIHKPVHHYGSWYWNYETKTWQNVLSHHNAHQGITARISTFPLKYRHRN